MVEGSGVQGGGDWGDQMHGQNTARGNEEVDIRRRHEAERLYRKELVARTLASLVSSFDRAERVLALELFSSLISFHYIQKSICHKLLALFLPCLIVFFHHDH